MIASPRGPRVTGRHRIACAKSSLPAASPSRTHGTGSAGGDSSRPGVAEDGKADPPPRARKPRKPAGDGPPKRQGRKRPPSDPREAAADAGRPQDRSGDTPPRRGFGIRSDTADAPMPDRAAPGRPRGAKPPAAAGDRPTGPERKRHDRPPDVDRDRPRPGG